YFLFRLRTGSSVFIPNVHFVFAACFLPVAIRSNSERMSRGLPKGWTGAWLRRMEPPSFNVYKVGVHPAPLRFYTVRSRVWGWFWPKVGGLLRNVRFMACY